MGHDGTFQKIDDADLERIGPRAILVCGFSSDIEVKLRDILAEISATEHRVLLCSEAMVKMPLRTALALDDPGTPAEADRLPRVILLSGLTGKELQGFLSTYREKKLPSPIFAATTETNLEFPLGKLVMELLREHRAMSKRR